MALQPQRKHPSKAQAGTVIDPDIDARKLSTAAHAMTSFRQIEANRRNALRSTGPKTEAGKRRSRRNAFRHGLTAETVVAALEDIEDYQAFEAAVAVDYDARTAVQRELVLRVASLLWRMRRATAIETDLLQIQAEILSDRRYDHKIGDETGRSVAYRVPQANVPCQHRSLQNDSSHVDQSDATDLLGFLDLGGKSRYLTYCFLRLANLDNGVFERLGRYEAALWRQVVQTLFALRSGTDKA
jgi:transposase